MWSIPDLIRDQNDVRQFATQIEQANEVVGGTCAVLPARGFRQAGACGDAGYANTAALKVLDEQGITVIVPSQDQARHTPRGAFDKSEFVYDAAQDCHRCPAGEILRYRKTDVQAGRKTYLITHPSICHCCVFWGACTQANPGLDPGHCQAA